MEDSYQSMASSGVTVHPRASPDHSSDAYVAPPVVPVVPPTTAPTTTTGTQQPYAETSRGPMLRRTPRMCVRDFPRGPLAPRDKAPMTEERVIHCVEQPQRVPRFAHLEWMTPMLGRWRSLEGLPSTFETGESSRSPAPLPTTGEPVELTIPTLVAVMRTLFRISAGRGSRIMGLQSEISRLEGDMVDIHEQYHFLFGNMVAAREIAEATRARVRALERRVRVAGLAIGACVLMAVLRTAVGLFLPYFY